MLLFQLTHSNQLDSRNSKGVDEMIFLISYCDKAGSIRTHRTNNSAKAYDFAITCSRPVNLTVWMDTRIPNYNIPRNFICESKDAIATAFATITTEYAKGVAV